MHIRVFVSMSNMDSYIHVIVHCHIRVCIYNACVYMYTYACIILHIHIYHQVLHHYCDKNKLVLEYKYTEEGPPHAKVCSLRVHVYAKSLARILYHTHTHLACVRMYTHTLSCKLHAHTHTLSHTHIHTHRFCGMSHGACE